MSGFEKYDRPDADLTWYEHIRKRPGMYLGTVNTAGFVTLLKSVFNEGDLTRPRLSLYRLELLGDKSAELTIVSELILVPRLQNLLPSGTSLTFSLGVLAAVSTKLETRLFDENERVLLTQSLERGKLIAGEPEGETLNCQKLKVTFQLDELIWGNDFTFNNDFIIQQLRDFAFLTPTTRFEVLYLKSGEGCKAIFQFQNGLWNYLEYLALDGLGSTRLRTAFNYSTDDFTLDVAFGIREYSIDQAFLKSYANQVYTFHEGTHVQALLEGISTGLETYLKQYSSAGDYDLSEENLRETLIGGISIVLKIPVFAGSTKTKLANEEIIEPIANEVARHFFAALESDKTAADDYIRNQIIRK